MRDKFFYAICFGFIFGAFFRSFFFLDNFLFFAILFFSFFTFLFFQFISKNEVISVAVLFLAFFALSVLNFNYKEKNPNESFEMRVGDKVEIAGLIDEEPQKRENTQQFVINIKEYDTRVLVNTSLSNELFYGDVLQVSGVLKKPENFITDNGKVFDYVNYLKKDGIFYTVSFAEVEKLAENQGNKIKGMLFDFKNSFMEKIERVVPRPESLLLGGLILGERESFPKEMQKSFVDTGTIHIVALSGYNVSIIADWIIKFFHFLPQVFALWTGIFAVILFVIMTGANATAVRAGIMAILALLARSTGRTYDVFRALVLAGVLMIFFNPFVLVYDVSFQLSFIATIAVIFVGPSFHKYFMWVTKKFELRDILATTVAAYIFVLPFILYKMGNLSLVAIPANFLILPFIPLVMIFGFLTGFSGFLSYFLSFPFGYISYLILHYQLFVIDFFARFSFVSFSVPNFPLVLTLLIYAYFIYLFFGKDLKKFFLPEEKSQ